MTLYPTPASEVGSWWAAVEPWIGRALNRARALETTADVRKALDERRRQLWVILEQGQVAGCVVSEIYETSAGLTCAMPIAAGHDRNIEPVLDQIEAWARAEGCVRLEGNGRMGWVKRLRAFGWRPATVMIEKDLR